jgi:tRNA-splicing ligase RtcB
MTTQAIFGKHDDATLEQLKEVGVHARFTALMADGHRGFVMPIGGVAAYDHQVSVVGVGFDIGCGNCAIRTNMTVDLDEDPPLSSRWERIADEIANTISFGIGRTNKTRDAPVDHGMFESADWDAIPSEAREFLRAKAQLQIGTVGGGNHYVDVFVDETGSLWVGVHFGSRGLGHTIASGFLALAQGAEWNTRVPEAETIFDLESELGQRYWAAMNLAGEYAHVGREYVARKVVDLIGGHPLETVHNHHNFAWREEHFGQDLIVVRKGATPAWPGQMGFVGGSMGDDAVILRGTTDAGDETQLRQEGSLYSTVHGAGRVMSRTAAKGKRTRQGKVVVGAVSREQMENWIRAKGVVVRGGDVDESPQCYRRLDEVLEAQADTVEVLHTLRPLLVVMAPPRTKDPYKD